MFQSNLLNLDIPESDHAEILAAMGVLTTKLVPHLRNLTKADRKALAKMGDKTVVFVEKAREYAIQFPQLVPAFLDMAVFNADLEGYAQLHAYLRSVEPITTALEDSAMLAGSEAYQAALMFYQSVKMGAAANVPNAKSVYEDLSARFPGVGRKRSAPAVAS